ARLCPARQRPVAGHPATSPGRPGRPPRRHAGGGRRRTVTRPLWRSRISSTVEFHDDQCTEAAVTPAIEVRDLVVRRGKREVLHGLTCTVPAGSVTGLLGPSGSGKTTLMRAIVGVQKVASGTVRVLGAPAGSAELRARVGYLTQAPSIYADLTVRE